MLSAAGGGILRDIVRQSGQVGTLKTEFYAEVPLLWGFAFSLFLMTRPVVLTPEEIRAAIFVTIAGVFETRMAVVMLGIRPFPFKWPPDRP
jgi:polar amino acid transport system substrate-binding protein